MSVLADLPRRTKIVALLGLVAVSVGGGALSFAPIVRARVVAAAERRGVRVTVGQVRVGWRSVWLEDLDLRVSNVPGVRAHVDAVCAELGWHFNLAGLRLHGAQVELQGDAEELRRQLAAYRGGDSGEAQHGNDVDYQADGVDIVWRRRSNEPTQRVWGLRYQRRGALEGVALDLARVQNEGVELEARRPEARLRRDPEPASSTGAARRLLSLHAEGVDLGIVLPSSANAVTTNTPRFRGLASPTLADAKASHFQPDPLRGAKLRAALSELTALAVRVLPEGTGLTLDGVSVRFRQGDEALNFGPSTLHAERTNEQVELSLVPKAEAAGTPLELKLGLPSEGGEVRVQLRGGPVTLGSLGVREGDFGLRDVQAATLQASGDVTLAADGSSVAFSGNGALDRVSLRRSELSPALLSGIHLAFRAHGTSTLDGAKLVLEDSELSLGDVRVQGSGSLTRGQHALQTHWSGGVPLASCQALLDATPRGLAPLIASLRMAGTFAVQAELDYDSEHPNETHVRLNVANDCRIEQVPPELDPRRFESFWRREVKGPDKQPMEVESGPGSPDWVPYDAISPFMEAAVLVCEDGHFPYHHGFDFEAIQNSIRDNLIKGRFARGASTISMQLAKNLYLGKEKTLGRKLQEAVLTQLLEQELSKRALMELYLNVIEYAPGIYGIGPAARYYFAKRPSDLSLGQALYIATILPNPERQHFDPDGNVSAAWTKYLQHLMHIARKIERITDEQLTTGLAEQVAFHVADSGGGLPASNPFPEEGTDTPSELSP